VFYLVFFVVFFLSLSSLCLVLLFFRSSFKPLFFTSSLRYVSLCVGWECGSVGLGASGRVYAWLSSIIGYTGSTLRSITNMIVSGEASCEAYSV
jgi:hypothetical protein